MVIIWLATRLLNHDVNDVLALVKYYVHTDFLVAAICCILTFRERLIPVTSSGPHPEQQPAPASDPAACGSVNAALSGSQTKAPGSAGRYVATKKYFSQEY